MIKKSAIALFACFAVAGSAFAGTAYVSSGKVTKEYKQPYEEPFTCFADQEFQLDLFGMYVDTDGGPYGDGFGGGIGMNYFFSRYVGVGIDAAVYDGGEAIGTYSGSFIFRYPIDSMCLAPYALIGGGYQHNGGGEYTLHAGGGLEWRVVPHRFALYGEGRYTFASDNAHVPQARLGVRLVF